MEVQRLGAECPRNRQPALPRGRQGSILRNDELCSRRLLSPGVAMMAIGKRKGPALCYMWGPLALCAAVLLTLAGFILDHLSGEERNSWEIEYVNDKAPAPASSLLGELQVTEALETPL